MKLSMLLVFSYKDGSLFLILFNKSFKKFGYYFFSSGFWASSSASLSSWAF